MKYLFSFLVIVFFTTGSSLFAMEDSFPGSGSPKDTIVRESLLERTPSFIRFMENSGFQKRALCNGATTLLVDELEYKNLSVICAQPSSSKKSTQKN